VIANKCDRRHRDVVSLQYVTATLFRVIANKSDRRRRDVVSLPYVRTCSRSTFHCSAVATKATVDIGRRVSTEITLLAAVLQLSVEHRLAVT